MGELRLRIGAMAPPPQVDARRDQAVDILRAAGIASAAADVRWIARLAPERFDELVALRRRRIPLQHLLGTVGFRHLELACDGRALIPRPETEVTAGAAIDAMPAGGRCLDLCTGAGPIALSVAREVKGATVVATDISAAALTLAEENARRCGLSVDFRRGDLFEPVGEETFDVVVANPPYVAEDEMAGLEPEVRDHDPRDALVAGPTGLEVLARIIEEAPRHIVPGGALVLEIAPRQADWARQHGDVVDDLAGRPRVLIVRPGRP